MLQAFNPGEMSLVPGNVNNLSIRVLCQLGDYADARRSGEVIRLEESCYYVGSGSTLFYVGTSREESSSVCAIEGITSITLFSQANRILFALNTDGYAVALHCDREHVEFLAYIDIDNQLQVAYMHSGNRFIRYDSDRNVLIMTVGDSVFISSVKGFVDDRITTSTLFIGQNEENVSTFSLGLWGNEDLFLLAYSSSSSDFTLRVLTKLPNGPRGPDEEPTWHITTDSTEIQTKHKCWITALSEVSNQEYSDIAASGDCAGIVILYTMMTTTEKKGKHSKVGKTPLQVLLANDSLCEGNAITSILINPQLNDLWIGDVSGAITSAHLSIKSKTLHPTRRLMLFGTVGGPSYLAWQPTILLDAEASRDVAVSADPTAQQKIKTRPSNSGVLSVFSPACGMLVECTVMESIESIFRVSPEPAVTHGGVAPEGESKGKLGAEEVGALFPSVIDACALLPHLNLMAVTSARSRTLCLWDLHSGLLQHSVSMEERFCKTLAAFDAPVPEFTITGAPVQNLHGSKRQSAWIAAGYSNGKFTLISLLRNAPPEIVPTTTAATTVSKSVTVPVVRESRPSRVSAHESAAASSTAVRPRVSSAHEVDILDTVGPHQSLEYGIGGAVGGADGHYLDDDDRSDTSEVSLGRFHGADGGSDDDSVGGGAAELDQPKKSRKQRNSMVTMRRTSVIAAGPLSHAIEIATSFCPLPITDILFSTSGKFIAICHIKKVIVVYNNHVDAKKVSLRVSFDEMFCDIQVLVPSELTPKKDRGRDWHGRRDSDDRTFTFTDAGRRASVPSAAPSTAPSTQHTATEQDEESLVLLLQSPTHIRLLDAIKGTILTQFGVEAAGAPIICSAAWDVPVAPMASNMPNTNDRAVTGICVAQDMRIFLFGGDSGQLRQYRLHDHLATAEAFDFDAPQLSMSLNARAGVHSRYFAGHLTQLGSQGQLSSASKLDNLVQGVSINELRTFSPLACVWSLRRLALLRMQLVGHKGAEVLRSEEYFIAHPNVRILYASGLKATPRMRNHRAVLVLSNGHIIVMHL